MVREMACKIIDSKTLGKHWVERFIQRHPEITSCIEVPLESARALNSTHDIIAEYFGRVQNLIQSHDILSDNIWNMDVTRIAMGFFFQRLCDFWQRQTSSIRQGTAKSRVGVDS
jgi:hypothetical protein